MPVTLLNVTLPNVTPRGVIFGWGAAATFGKMGTCWGMTPNTSLAQAITGVAFIAAGTMHFVHTKAYVRIVPDYLPSAHALVAISGVAEIAGGLGVLVPMLRRPAGMGLLALLVAVFPANIFMATDLPTRGIPPWALWLRLPLQGVLMW